MSIAAFVLIVVTTSLVSVLLYGTYRFHMDPDDKLPSFLGPGTAGKPSKKPARPKPTHTAKPIPAI